VWRNPRNSRLDVGWDVDHNQDPEFLDLDPEIFKRITGVFIYCCSSYRQPRIKRENLRRMWFERFECFVVIIVTAECGEVAMHESDGGDEPDCPAATPHENVQLKQLCSRLRRDLKQILLFSTADCQVLYSDSTISLVY